ncbi:MobQ family relaxase [Frisingicoccus sp.]
MSIYHCSIKIISRSGGRSAIASAAYRSGERLYNDETGIIHDFSKKGGVITSEILLPPNAPSEYANREILWNEVQKIEKRSDAQFAREVEVALPTEMTRQEQIECIRAFVKENFVKEGMIADWALHDKGDGNPHAHIMLTVRGLDENKKWQAKQKTVFANSRDEQGRAIYNPELPSYNPKDREHTSMYRIPSLDKNGNQKTRVREGKGTEYLWEKISIPLNDWNDRTQAEKWRASWAEHCNRYLSPENKIDHRSYKRQGLDIEPTIHEGVTARNMEQNGKISDRCQMNREVRQRNHFREEMRLLAKEITEFITEKARDVYERFRKFTGSIGHHQQAGRDDIDTGNPAKRNRRTGEGKLQLEGTAGRITDLKRATKQTDTDIEKTEQSINRLKEELAIKERDRDARMQRLKQRRSASGTTGGNAGSDRDAGIPKDEAGYGELKTTGDDIRAFLSSLASEERGAKEKQRDSFTQREDRDAERQRQIAEAKRKEQARRRRYSRESR